MDLKALYQIGYGVYVVCSKDEYKINGQIANTLFQVSSEPAIIATAINRNNLTNEFIKKSGVFSASILSQDTPLSFIGQFGFKSGRDINKFQGVNYRLGQTGAPIALDNALAFLEARVTGQMEVGTHTLFAGELVDAGVLQGGEPMTYAYYHTIKRGTTPRNAPTFVAEKKEEKPAMAKYECSVCGYVYDPEAGDPDGKIPPGTPFENLPDSWVCPVCGAAKSEFKKLG